MDIKISYTIPMRKNIYEANLPASLWPFFQVMSPNTEQVFFLVDLLGRKSVGFSLRVIARQPTAN
jgi:hypothetical protein